MKHKIIILAFVLTVPHVIHARPPQDSDCMLLLKGIYDKLGEIAKPSTDKIAYLNYTVKTVMNEKLGGGIHTSEIKIYANKEKSYLISKEIEVYQDQECSVTIIPDRKLIYINDYIGNTGKERKISQLSFMQDTLFALSKVKLCEEFNDHGSLYKKIKIELNESGKRIFKTSYLTFYIDLDNSLIKKIECDYVPSHQIASLEVTFLQFDNDFLTNKLDKPILSTVFQSNEKLLSTYRDFRVVDTRVKNR